MITEGGLANAVHELLEDEGLGVEIDLANVYIFPESKVLCEQYRLDPLGVIASGALLIVAAPEAAEKIYKTLTSAQIVVNDIGRVLPKNQGRWLVENNDRCKLPLFRFDEMIRVLS